jgi:hypothetical protein
MRDPTKAVVKDAEDFASRFGVRFSKEGLTVLREAEELACSLDDYVFDWTYMAALLKNVKVVRAALARHGVNPDLAAESFDTYTRSMKSGPSTSYDHEDSYSSPFRGNRRSSTRARVIDFAINMAQRRDSPITGLTFFEALLACHDETYPFISNGNFTDEHLHTPHTTLAHVLGQYDENLSIKLSDLRHDLGLPFPKESYEHPTEAAPPPVRSALLALFVDHPNYERNCFLIMPFATTRLHNEITRTLKAVMKSYEFDLVRADDHVYSEDLLTNIQAHIYGCRFAIAVFERILTNDFNPNVSLEVGYCLGLRKPVCLLKELTLPRLPSDLVGRLYDEFDSQDVRGSIPPTIQRWLRNRGLIANTKADIAL